MAIILKSDREIDSMKKAGEIVAMTFERLEKELKPGIKTIEIDKIADEFIRSKNAIPSFKGYGDFPSSICISVNNVVIHGIAGKQELQDGDIVSLDVGAYIEGFHGDAARTFPVGKITDEDKRLIRVSEESFFEGIKYAKEGYFLNDICKNIGAYILKNGFSIVKDFVGHGVGRALHEDPQIPNYDMNKRGPRLQAGMTLAIEPMLNYGKEDVIVLEDNWTVLTVDKTNSAHYENTILISKSDPVILTTL